MKVIFLTQYYPPETGAPQNRIQATVNAFVKNGVEVTVLTAMPNYPGTRVHAGYRWKWFVRERMEGAEVLRAPLFVPKGRGFFGRLCNYFSFMFTSLFVGLFTLKRSDVLFVESPPLFLGISAMLLARVKRSALVFNVSDLWPESAVALGLVKNKALIRASTWLELRCYERATLITGQTQGIVRDIARRCPHKRVLWLPNGVDFDAIGAAEETIGNDRWQALGIPPGSLVLAYAGILGHAQGLEVMLHAAAQLGANSGVHFLLIGEGPEKPMLAALKTSLELNHVHMVGHMQRGELLTLLRSVDAVVVPLRRNDLFKGAIPSKIFEALALSKPLLLGVEGEAKELFIDEGKAGLAFVPEDVGDLVRNITTLNKDRQLLLELGANGRRYVQAKFDRSRINAQFVEELRAVGSATGAGTGRASGTAGHPSAPRAAGAGKSTIDVLAPLVDHPRVSVAIPCRNEQGFIGACLRSIIAADRSGMDLHVFVCDGMSDDGTRQEIAPILALHSFVSLIDNPQRTTPIALNLGLRAIPCDVGIILGAHAEVTPDFFRTNIAALRRTTEAGCAGGVIESMYTDPVSRGIGAAMAHPFGVGGAHFRTGRKSGFVDTVAFGAYRSEVFKAVGWFDEVLTRNQDDEFNFRLTEAGFRILLDPAIKSRYVVRASFNKLWRQYYQYGYWKVYVNRKHRSVTTARQLVPALWIAFLALGAPIAVFSPFVRWLFLFGTMAYVLAALVAALSAAPVADLPKVLRAFVTLHAAYGLGYWAGIFRFVLRGASPARSSESLSR